MAVPSEADHSVIWAVIGGGPSLTVEDVEACKGLRVLAINDAYKICPWADAVYAADSQWWAVHANKVKPDFEGRMYSVINSTDKHNPYINHQVYGVNVFKAETDKNTQHVGLSRKKDTLHLGGLSGYQGINVVYHWCAKVILLLGFDCTSVKGKNHWFGDHPKPLRNGTNFSKYVSRFRTIIPEDYGIEIVNCSRVSAIDAFPKMTIHEALEKYA